MFANPKAKPETFLQVYEKRSYQKCHVLLTDLSPNCPIPAGLSFSRRWCVSDTPHCGFDLVRRMLVFSERAKDVNGS